VIRGFYTAVSGTVSDEQRLTTILNNIANAQTTGYKQYRIANSTFHEMLVSRLDGSAAGTPSGDELGAVVTSSGVDDPILDLSPGALVKTSRTLDVALSGEGYLVVETPDGTRYTRAGSLSVDPSGMLVQPDGNPVLGVDGRVFLKSGDIRIDPGGRLFVGDEPAGQLRLVEIAPEDLRKVGDNYFEAADSAVGDASDTSVSQGYLEASNVDATQSVAELMAVARSYSAAQQMLRLQDEVLGRTVGELGRLG
jgi:flagellar basal-body rod protein FlgG